MVARLSVLLELRKRGDDPPFPQLSVPPGDVLDVMELLTTAGKLYDLSYDESRELYILVIHRGSA